MVEISDVVEANPLQQSPLPPDSAPAPMVLENSATPQPQTAAAPLPSPYSTQPFLYKIHLHEYTQKSRIPLPVYQTVDEGCIGETRYRSTVLVDEVCYVSPNTFRNRRGAEQDAARIAIEYLSKKSNDDGLLLLHEDLKFCKSILSEYTDKMNLKRPMYETKQHKSLVPVLQTTLVFDGVVYIGDVSRSKKEAEQLAARGAILSLLGDAGNPKSQKTLASIISSKVRLHATLQKVKDSNPSQIQPKLMLENTEEHVAMAVNEDKEVKDAILDNRVISGVISDAPPTMSHFRPEFRSTKLEASSPPVSLPIEFVPSTLEEPVGDHAIGSKKQSRNKTKVEHKNLCLENGSPTNQALSKPEASFSLASLPIKFDPSTLEEPVGVHSTGSKKRSRKKKARAAHKKLCVENRATTEMSQTASPCSIAQ